MKKFVWNLGAAILLGITSLFGVSCSCLDQAEDSAAVEVLPRTPSVEKQEGLTKSYQIGQDYAHFYEYNHGTDVPISFVNSNRADDYITPLDYFETTKGFNGGTNVGKLTVSGKGLEKIGFYKPSNSFDYTAFKVGENVDFTFDFASVTSCGLADYAIADCATSTADNFYLGGRMGTGALLILKRTADSSNWVKADDVARIGLANGRRLTLSVGGSDLTAGTYYRFVSFYQYSYHYATNPGPLGISGLDIHRYTFFNVMQRVTVYVASGGTDVAFATETSPTQTHDLSLRHYASQVAENKAYLKEENIVEESKDVSISLTGEVIKASESDIDVESKVPVYLYNGVESTVTFKAKPSSSASSSSVSASAAANFVYSEHPNSKDPIYFGTNSITKGVFYVQACGQDGSGKRIWTSVGTRNSDDANSISLPTTIFEDYPLYRAAYFYPKTKGDTSLLCSSVAYFSLAIKEGKQFKGKYTVEEGFDSAISVSGFKAAATLNDGSTCYSSFSVACAIPSYVIEYAHNDEPFTVLHVAKKTFTDPGKYRFRVTNAFAESKYTTIYIMDIRDDNGTATFFSKYDGFFLSQEYRVYEPDSRVPCYGLGAPFYMNASPYLPGLYGTIKRIYADGTTQVIQSFEDLHAPLTGVMNEVGDYVAEISPGDPNGAGDRIAYTIFFNVVDPAKYTPRINKDLFHSGVFTASMMKKVFCVDVPTKGKGNLRYLFPYQQEGYDEALTFAMAQEAKVASLFTT